MKKLDQLRQDSKEIKDKIDDTEERTHRLITRGAILESLIENAEELTDEEIIDNRV